MVEKRMKVLLLSIPTSWISGVTTVFLQLSYGLRKNGLDVANITHGWTRGQNPKFMFSVKENNGNIYSKYYDSMEGIVQNELMPRKFIPDIIHAQTHTYAERFGGDINTLLKATKNPPMIYTLHAIIGYLKLPPDIRKRFFDMSKSEIEEIKRTYASEGQYEMMKLSNKLVTISEMHTRVIEKMYPELSSKCVTIRNSSDLMEYNGNKGIEETSLYLRKKIAPNNEKIILYTGRIEEDKGVPNLIKAFNIISKKYAGAKLAMVGGNESSASKMVSWGLYPSLRNNLYFTGWLSKKEVLASYYKMISSSSGKNVAGIMIMPVRTKNLLGLAVLEAMSMKAPVITCENDEKLGFGITPEPENLAKTADYMFSHPDNVHENVEHTYNIIKTKYSIDNYIRNHINLYASVLGERGKLFDISHIQQAGEEAKTDIRESKMDEIFRKSMKIEIVDEKSMDDVVRKALSRKI